MFKYLKFRYQQLRKLFDLSLGFDLGSSFFRVWQPNTQKIETYPHVIAVDKRQHKVVGLGNDAQEMQGKVPDHIVIVHPFERGIMKSFSMSRGLFQHVFHQILGKFFFFKPLVMASVASDATQIERQAISEALFAAGARQVYLIDSPLAAAIGAGIPVAESNGNIVIHMGGGITEIAVISLGSIVMIKSIRVGGEDLDKAIQHQIRKTYFALISLETAQMIKEQLLDLRRSQLRRSLNVKAKDLVTGQPKEITIESIHILTALERPLRKITAAIQRFLEEIPAELASDVIDKGVILTGGAAKLLGYDFCLSQVIGVPVSLSDESDLCVIRGVGLALKHLDLYRNSLAFETI